MADSCPSLGGRRASVYGSLAGAAFVWALAACAPAAVPAPAPAPASRLVGTVSQLPAYDPELIRYHHIVNAHRRRIGCPALRLHSGLSRTSQAHANDRVRRGYVDHVTPEGVTETARLRRAGVRWNGPMGEVVLRATDTAPIAHDLWVNSPSHRRVIQNCRYTYHGVGRKGFVRVQMLLVAPLT